MPCCQKTDRRPPCPPEQAPAPRRGLISAARWLSAGWASPANTSSRLQRDYKAHRRQRGRGNRQRFRSGIRSVVWLCSTSLSTQTPCSSFIFSTKCAGGCSSARTLYFRLLPLVFVFFPQILSSVFVIPSNTCYLCPVVPEHIYFYLTNEKSQY